MKSVDNLIRKIKLTDFFSRHSCTRRDVDSFSQQFVGKSDWSPPISGCSLSTKETVSLINQNTEFILRKYVRNGFLLSVLNTRNLSSSEFQAIRTLRDDNSIIIRSADKGGSIVIMDAFLYNRECYRQLNDLKYYRPIPDTVSVSNSSKINEVIYRLRDKGLISNKQFGFLLCDTSPRLRNFYLLPKVHKEKSKWTHFRMPPGRPIVTCCNTEFDKIGKFIDYFLQPLSMIGGAYTKDTYHFVSRVRGQFVDPNSFLVTADVSSLYTNMDINLILEVVHHFFTLFPNTKRPNDELIELLNIILHGNDFFFDNRWYLQVLGMAMGNPCAPSCANLFLKKLDTAAMNYRIPPSFFSRFLDDIFFVWNGTLNELKEFEIYLNLLIPNITLSFSVSPLSVNFLDVTVFKNFEHDLCTLETRPYFKDTDTHQLLHKSSFHPKHIFASIVKSQYIRFKRLSSFKVDYDTSCRTLNAVLLTRGYSKRFLRSTQNKIWFEYNANLDRFKVKPEILPMVIAYDSIGVYAARKWRDILSQNDTFSNLKIITAYSIHRNLRSLLTCSRNIPDVNSALPGSIQCSNRRCVSCRFMTESVSFSSSISHRIFKLRSRITCKSSNVIYLVTCRKCSMQYVGETGCPLHVRILNHLSCIKLKKPSSIALHFNLTHHKISDFSFTPIELLEPTTTLSERRKREAFWQIILETRHPRGINNFNITNI